MNRLVAKDVIAKRPSRFYMGTNNGEQFTIARTWTATDACGNTSSHVQTIEVVDTTAPVISFNATSTIIPPDAPISFSAITTDNCDSDPSIVITGYDCFFLTKKGKRIDKKASCVVRIAGDTITILDSGGVNIHIEWNVPPIIVGVLVRTPSK